MGRSYFGLVNGEIPKFVKTELPFTEIGCKFTGYMLRYNGCGCNVYEYSELEGNPKLYTECKYGSKHTKITSDTSFARWIYYRNDIDKIHEQRREIEQLIPIRSYVYLDEDHEIKFRNQDDLDSLSYETNYQIFKWIILTQLLVSFDRYMTNHSITFTSETV
jgi:hypothetical protein